MFGSFQRCASRLLSAGFVVFTVAMITPPGLRGQDVISLSVSPLQDAEKDGATVIRDQGGEWVTLREGSGPFGCIADDPSDALYCVNVMWGADAASVRYSGMKR